MSLIPSLGNPLAWGLLAAIPVAIVLLYFLKLKREPVEVPSTYLWSKTIEDLHVNSLLQRLRRSLLLLLQLLAVAVAVIALLRPGAHGEKTGQGRSVFLFDTSASMQSVDDGETLSRFEKAKQLIRNRIDAMSDTDTAMLITFSDRPETVQSFTTDRARLRNSLDSVQVTNHSTDILGALKAADGLANPRRSSDVADVMDVQVADAKPADLLIYSDGGFQPVTEFSLGNLKQTFISMGSERVNNVAITAFSTERNTEQPSEVQAYATIANFGGADVSTTATLSLNGNFLDAASVEIEAGEETGLSFTIESEEAASLSLALDLEDELALDNIAYTGLRPLRNVSVLVVTAGNSPLSVGLKTEKTIKICTPTFVLPSYLQTEEYRQRASAGIDDLIIYDSCSPSEMPATNTFFIAALPPASTSAPLDPATATTDPSTQAEASEEPNGAPNDPANAEVLANDKGNWRWASEISSVNLIDIERTHPLMRYLELFSLLIFSGRGIEGPPGTIELVGADIGSVLAIAPRDGFQDLVLGFGIISRDDDGNPQTNTNWYAERSWPVFLYNLLRYLAGAADATGAPSFRPGNTVRLRLDSSLSDLKIRRVGEPATKVTLGPNGVIEIVDTEVPGNYRIENGSELTDLFAINLFDRRESATAAVKEFELGYESVTSETQGVEQRIEYWRWALIAMLGLIAAEWWVYTRRVA